MIENFRIWIYISLMIEVFGGLFLLSHMLPLRNIKHRRSFTVCYFLCYSALLSAQDYWSVASKANAYPVFLAMHILLMFLYSVIFCEGKFVFKIFLPLVYVSIVTLSGFPVNLLHQFFPEVISGALNWPAALSCLPLLCFYCTLSWIRRLPIRFLITS